MQRIASIGDKQFIYGMKWVHTFDGDNPRDLLTDALDFEVDGCYCVQEVGTRSKRSREKLQDFKKRFQSWRNGEEKQAPDTRMVGIGTVPKRSKGTVYSYAASLAAVAQDGIYIAPTNDHEPRLWHVTVHDHMVTPETDQIGGLEDVVQLVRNLRKAGSQPLFIPKGYEEEAERLGLNFTGTFDPLEALKSPVAVKVFRSHANWSVYGRLGVASLVVAGGIGWWWHGSNSHSQEQQEELAKQSFVSSITSMVGKMPSDPTWPIEAMAAIPKIFPAFESGWVLQSVDCTVVSCEGSYTRDPLSTAYAISPLIQRFGMRSIHQDPSGKTLKATWMMPIRQGAPIVAIDETLLRSLRPNPHLLKDWTGLLPMYIPDMAVSKMPLQKDFSNDPSAQMAHFTAVVVEQAMGESADEPNTALIKEAVIYGQRAGFSPINLSITMGFAQSEPKWSMTWERLHG